MAKDSAVRIEIGRSFHQCIVLCVSVIFNITAEKASTNVSAGHHDLSMQFLDHHLLLPKETNPTPNPKNRGVQTQSWRATVLQRV